MKNLMISAALAALAAGPAAAQSVGAGLQVNPPMPTQVGAQAHVPGLPPGAPPADEPGAKASVRVPGVVGDLRTEPSIDDSRTLNPGSASVDASARVGMNLSSGMEVQGMEGVRLGEVVSMTKDAYGKVTAVTIRTRDGVKRTLAPSDLTVKGKVAVTTKSEAQLVAMPQAK